jgi:hypothetical protein
VTYFSFLVAASTMASNPKIECQCGTISLVAPIPKPTKVFVCHCLECRKQSSSAFGISALFPADGIWPFPEHLEPYIGVWTRKTDAGNTTHCYFCKKCGVRILHRGILANGQEKPGVRVRGGCLEGITLEGATHIWTRSALVPVPEGSALGEP